MADALMETLHKGTGIYKESLCRMITDQGTRIYKGNLV